MATLVCLHAHPDDEAIATGGSMVRAHAEGHRVVLIVATDGAHGEVPDDLADGETLEDRRRTETMASATALGIDRVEFLEYTDSGMTGWDQNDHHEAFCQADLDTVAGRVADLLREEIDFLGQVKLSAVEQTQQGIVDVVRRLEDTGELDLHPDEQNEQFIG